MSKFIDWLLSLFRRPALPHPQEAQNPKATFEAIDKTSVQGRWLQGWQVPVKYHDYWLNQISLYVYDRWPTEILSQYVNVREDTPGFALQGDNGRAIYVLASWLSPGVIAHEQAHNAYALLDDAERKGFEAAYTPLIKTDPLIKLLYSQNRYGLTDVIEGHAEVYRYLGEQMPDQLKRYYPKLF